MFRSSAANLDLKLNSIPSTLSDFLNDKMKPFVESY